MPESQRCKGNKAIPVLEGAPAQVKSEFSAEMLAFPIFARLRREGESVHKFRLPTSSGRLRELQSVRTESDQNSAAGPRLMISAKFLVPYSRVSPARSVSQPSCNDHGIRPSALPGQKGTIAKSAFSISRLTRAGASQGLHSVRMASRRRRPKQKC